VKIHGFALGLFMCLLQVAAYYVYCMTLSNMKITNLPKYFLAPGLLRRNCGPVLSSLDRGSETDLAEVSGG
jgi:hypothetical protein